ncbi:phosphoribosylformylglycinamidine synthase subunit PurQ [Acidomonas methanolica]|uniref:Phosphoribosylformylglycinamidine synthase subunit PurQ n=1 Tax=Acidomonas methanolica NBRC 104435 TaxID=1231351 RepID=A0A023D0N7_ACIMT|nr:phosphoribosylformylglycinamidine synthase subunit PurQ [Acidomonas methanolica]MBU2653372.1 phosphoribosylformylglycinamidine synthase subunit PurQ [Acidomonas methanolica]TCS32323.1 phosphoribosylformylglycinamidine synthase [Acidomonas methanolica]GAJ27698.1 phosphoribosylformylglycinamidine synthase I [Acidomonas methanolica NBRC 104435]GBQ53126.1 phosphoribosylformylglycinamidine synthase I [Acidomonas methanolica]GEK97760.1 phosphoribosylformylglycinamidine synthase subunit PurQ [Acid
MKAGIVVFPGTNRERDMAQALRLTSGRPPQMLWHRDTSLPALDLVVLPGGFSFGDYLRSGAMAAHSPIMREIKAFAARGGHVLGVCNGFQILTEAQLLPGALLRNAGMRFLAQDCFLKVENEATVFTSGWRKGAVFRSPMAHGDGNYTVSAEGLARLEGEGRVAFRYCAVDGAVSADDRTLNPNGSINAIAGVLSENGRVCGLMPHPENLVDPDLGATDGVPMFRSLVESLVA